MSHFSRKLFREPFQSFTVKFFLNCKINHVIFSIKISRKCWIDSIKVEHNFSRYRTMYVFDLNACMRVQTNFFSTKKIAIEMFRYFCYLRNIIFLKMDASIDQH